MTEFLSMGGYAAYVWGSYGAATAILVFSAASVCWHARRVRRELRAAATLE
jgi:heme exporter protein D